MNSNQGIKNLKAARTGQNADVDTQLNIISKELPELQAPATEVEEAAKRFNIFNADGGYKKGTGLFGMDETLAESAESVVGKPKKGLTGEIITGTLDENIDNLAEQVAGRSEGTKQGEAYAFLVQTFGKERADEIVNNSAKLNTFKETLSKEDAIKTGLYSPVRAYKTGLYTTAHDLTRQGTKLFNAPGKALDAITQTPGSSKGMLGKLIRRSMAENTVEKKLNEPKEFESTVEEFKQSQNNNKPQ